MWAGNLKDEEGMWKCSFSKVASVLPCYPSTVPSILMCFTFNGDCRISYMENNIQHMHDTHQRIVSSVPFDSSTRSLQWFLGRTSLYFQIPVI